MIPQYFGCDTDYEGQVFLTVKYPLNARSGIAKHAFEAKVREQVKAQGSIRAFSTLPNPGGEEMLLLAEFSDADRVPRALRRLNGARVDVRDTFPCYTSLQDANNSGFAYERQGSSP